MAGDIEQLFAVAGRVHAMLRRETSRVIDVEWVIANADYAREVVKLARATNVEELMALAKRIESAHPLLVRERQLEDKAMSLLEDTPRYVQTLR